MPIESSDKQSVEKASEKQSLAVNFGSSLFDAAVQRPVNAVGQIVGHELPLMQLVHVDKPTTSAEKIVTGAGAAIGTLAPFLLSRGAVRGALGEKLGTGVMAAVAENAATGFVVGSVFSPTEKGQNFWTARLASGLTDAGTFAALGGTSKALAGSKAFMATTESTMLARVGLGSAKGALSGLPAGFVNAELGSLTSGRGMARGDEVSNHMRDYALFGAALGGIDGIARIKARAAQVPESAKPAEVAETKLPAEGKPVQMDALAATKIDKAIPVDSRNYIGEGDEGKVYSNLDGTVTKVFLDPSHDVQAVKSIFDRLDQLGVRTPKISAVGTTAEGHPAMRIEQIGDGDHLRYQLISGELTAKDMTALNHQYYDFADKIINAGIRIDWQLKNMRFQDGKLYILDPSFLKEQPMSESLVELFSSSIGPRRR